MGRGSAPDMGQATQACASSPLKHLTAALDNSFPVRKQADHSPQPRSLEGSEGQEEGLRGPPCGLLCSGVEKTKVSVCLNQGGGQNEGSGPCGRGSLLHPEQQELPAAGLLQGPGRGGHSSSIWEVTRKDNKLPPQGPWGYESKAVLGGW